MINIPHSDWHDCYGESWKGIITPESFTHPAKFSKALIERIFDHCLKRGWLKRGDVVGDCFGGIGNGGTVAAYRGLKWVGVELESKFVKMSQDNFALHSERLRTMGLPLPEIIQGDSRKFHELISVSGVVTSPPYNKPFSQDHNGTRGGGRANGTAPTSEDGAFITYGQTPGQIEGLKNGEVDVVITSPPYADSLHTNEPPLADAERIARKGITTVKIKPHQPSATLNQGYSDSDGQIGRLKSGEINAVVTSPPFGERMCYKDKDRNTARVEKLKANNPQIGGITIHEPAGDSIGNISQLEAGRMDAVVTSPPFENQEGALKGSKFKFLPSSEKGHGCSPEARQKQLEREEQKVYGNSEGQIGNEQKETYWMAMKQVYTSCFLAIKRGGIIAVVVKDYVQNKKIVPLCDDTARLLEHCGFTVIERVHAMLTKETRHGDLFNGETVTTKSRKSFFRRLAEKKGSPPIDFEEVIFARRPA